MIPYEEVNDIYNKPYRGSKKSRNNRLLIILIALLLVLAVLTVFFVAQEYIVFTSEGFKFDFPFLRDNEPPTSEPPTTINSSDINLEIENTTKPPTTAPTTMPPAVDFSIRAMLIAPDDVADFSADEPINGFAVYIRNTDGVLTIPSAGGDTPTAGQTAFAATIKGSYARKVAIVSALRDAVGPRANKSNALKTSSGATWLDREYIPWYSAYAGGTTEQLVAAVDAASLAGFDEVLLTNMQFPTLGKIDLIMFGNDDSPDNRVKAITSLAEAAAIEDGPRISVLLTETAATQLVDYAAGQDVRALAKHCAALYVSTQKADFDLSALQEAVQGSGCKIGLLYTGQDAPQCDDYIITG